MKKILILTDFSDNAWNAISYVTAFYSTSTAVSYIIAHVITPKNEATLLTRESDYISNQLVATKKKIQETTSLKEHQVTVTSVEANFTEGIKKIAKDYKVDLLVMGSQGASKAINKATGSHTNAIITKVKYPTLIIPESTVFRKPLNTGLLTDYNFIFKPKVLTTLATTLAIHQSNLSVLRVENSKLPLSSFQQTNRTYLKDFFKETSKGFYKVAQSDLEISLQSFVDSMEIDMIAMLAKNLNFFQKLLFNQREVKMNYHLKIPFLILHE